MEEKLVKISDVVSLRILDPAMRDWELKDALTAARQQPGLQEIVVLPVHLRRAKQLLLGTDIRLGAVVDYPLGCGTVAKKAFEVGKSFQEGADFLELTVNGDALLQQPEMAAELERALVPLASAWGEIRTRLDSREITELTKIYLGRAMKEWGWPCLVLGQGTSIENALHDATTIAYEGGDKLKLQINLERITPEDLQELVNRGVARVGLTRFEDLNLQQELRQIWPVD